MDTSEPAVLVNGDILRSHVGKKVRTVIQGARFDGGVWTGKSTDEKPIAVKGNIPASFPTGFAEVIGVAENEKTISAEFVTDFGLVFDTNNFNQLCQLANGEFRHLFI